ncbi:MAG: helix-hairpin-helix domain-containing protein [Flavitalea sp.]
MDNYSIADQFSLLAKLMDIHGENSFKSKSYSSAAFTIEKLPFQLVDMDREKLFSIKGIGESVGKKVLEILDNGHLSALEELIQKTPQGVMDIMSIKGLGPKKVSTIWKEMEIESLGELLHACQENRLARYKGFGEKTQQSVEASIHFYLKSKGSHLYAEIDQYATFLNKKLQKKFELIEPTGAYRRQLEIIDTLEWVTTATVEDLQDYFSQHGYEQEEAEASTAMFRGPENVLLTFYCVEEDLFYKKLFDTSCSEEFLEAFTSLATAKDDVYTSEEDIFKKAGKPYLPPFVREKKIILEKSNYTSPLDPKDIKGIIHSHSTWSDGSHTLEKMAEGCISRGLEYLVISDHSKSAFYANGLQEERIIAQHQQIEELNKTYKNFRIFKSIESDILNDGALDYSDEILKTFDLVIASVHSNLKMTEEKAMTRLIKAIENPYTTILGHLTGRLLLSRPGYPVNHEKIIDACKANNVVIELNANPRRLDMDWRYIDNALDKGVMISVDPDAHSIEEFDNCKYGVLSAQKAGLTKEQNLSSYGLKEFEQFLSR